MPIDKLNIKRYLLKLILLQNMFSSRFSNCILFLFIIQLVS